MQKPSRFSSFFGPGPALQLAAVQEAAAQQSPVIAIDIALEPDAAMMTRAMASNARLLKAFPKGFLLDESHHPHISLLQQFVRVDELDRVCAAADQVLAREQPANWSFKAFKYYYIPSPPLGLAGIVIEPSPQLHRLQDEIIKAVGPYTVKSGSTEAFFSTEGGHDIQQSLILYVAAFESAAAGQHFNPHVTVGVATTNYLDSMLAEPFEAFTFRAAGASVYQLGSFGSARKELKVLTI